MQEQKPKKTVEEEIAEYRQERKRYVRIYNTVQWTILVLTVIAWFINWRLGVMGIIWLLWNCGTYESGCQADVVDEYELDGYPQDGLRRMFKSWILFAILAGIALYFLYQISFQTPTH